MTPSHPSEGGFRHVGWPDAPDRPALTPEASLRHRQVPGLAVVPTGRMKQRDNPPLGSIPSHRHDDGIRLHSTPAPLSITRCIVPYMQFRPISARPPLSQKLKEEPDRLFLSRETMLPPLTSCADTPPSADETGLAEEVGLDRHGIIAGHVFLGVDAFDIELVALRDHDTENRAGPTQRPTTCLNRSVSIDSC